MVTFTISLALIFEKITNEKEKLVKYMAVMFDAFEFRIDLRGTSKIHSEMITDFKRIMDTAIIKINNACDEKEMDAHKYRALNDLDMAQRHYQDKLERLINPQDFRD